jgi:hypothetical protein
MLPASASHHQHRAAHPGTLAYAAVGGPLVSGPPLASRAMAQHPRPPLSRAEREAHRALLEEALARLATADDTERSASDVMRALDAYLEATGGGTALSPREPPVTDYAERREQDELRWVKWFVIGGAALATAVVAVTLSGGWPAGLVIIGIWVLALFALLST